MSSILCYVAVNASTSAGPFDHYLRLGWDSPCNVNCPNASEMSIRKNSRDTYRATMEICSVVLAKSPWFACCRRLNSTEAGALTFQYSSAKRFDVDGLLAQVLRQGVAASFTRVLSVRHRAMLIHLVTGLTRPGADSQE